MYLETGKVTRSKVLGIGHAVRGVDLKYLGTGEEVSGAVSSYLCLQ